MTTRPESTDYLAGIKAAVADLQNVSRELREQASLDIDAGLHATAADRFVEANALAKAATRLLSTRVHRNNSTN